MSLPDPREFVYLTIAVQMELIDPAEGLQFVSIPKRDDATPLGEQLVATGRLTAVQDELLHNLVDAYLASHAGDAEQAAASLGDSTIGRRLASIVASDDEAATTDYTPRPDESSRVGSGLESLGIPADRGSERFRTIRSHASGGLGEVFLARDEQLHRDVALKRMLPRHVSNATRRLRFVFEGQITGALEHPGIVPVYALAEEADGSPYYVMRFVKGRTLRKVIRQLHRSPYPSQRFRRNSLALRGVLSRLIAVSQALEYAHERGVLHRDIKPANIMVGRHGETYLVDWGLARAAGQPDDDPSVDEEFLGGSRPWREATTAGSIIGTPGYMSPEQALGKLDALGPWSDVYSLGATLYAVLTERPPFEIEDSNVVEYIQRVTEGSFPTPRGVQPAAPRELEAICLRAMAIDPSDRIRSAADFALELERWLADEPVESAKPTITQRVSRFARRNRRAVTTGAIALALATVASLVATQVINRLRLEASSLAQRNAALAEAEASARQTADRRYLAARERVDKWLIGYSDALRNYPGMGSVRERILQEAAKEYATFAEEAVDDPTLEFERGLTLVRLGVVRRRLSDPTRALDAFREAEQLFAGLAENPNDDATLQAARAGGLAAMTNADLGDYDAAELELEKTLDSLRVIAAADPGAVEPIAELATASTNLAIVLNATANSPAARLRLAESIENCERLVALEPDELSHRVGLATATLLRGQVGLAEGKARQAASDFDRSANLFEAVAGLDQTNPQRRAAVAAARLNQATALRRLGDIEAEAASYRLAIDAYRLLAESNPGVAGYQTGLGMALMDFGQALVEVGRLDDANATLRDAVQLLRRLTDEQPRDPRRREAYGAATDSLADALLRRGQFAEAMAATEGAVAALAPLAEAWPDVVPYQQRLAVALTRRAHALAVSGQDEDADVAFEEANEQARALLERANETAESLAATATILTRVGEWRWARGDDRDGETLGEARTTWEALAERSDDPAVLDQVAWFLGSCPLSNQRSRSVARRLADRALSASPGNRRFQSTMALVDRTATDELSEDSPSLKALTDPAVARRLLCLAYAALAEDTRSRARDLYERGDALRRSAAPGDWQLAVLAMQLRAGLGIETGTLFEQPTSEENREQPE